MKRVTAAMVQEFIRIFQELNGRYPEKRNIDEFFEICERHP